jgi:hypothetical protein
MKTQILFLILTISILSCKKETESTATIEIINDSSHYIKITPYQLYFIGYYKDTLVIPPNNSEIVSQSSRGGINPFDSDNNFIRLDSITVIYNDTLQVVHGSSLYSVNRSLTKYKSYIYEDRTEKKHLINHHFEYTFTNADFDEAKTK